MSDLNKFGWISDGKDEQPYEYPNVWIRQTNDRMDRLEIGPRAGYVKLLGELAKTLEEPFLLLYVLVVSRGEAEPGRYQSEHSFTLPELQRFLSEYSSFLENDARHNPWIRSGLGDGMLVYDRHNVLYAYGPIEQFINVLTARGLTESHDPFLRFPSPHVHHYHSEFDHLEARLLRETEWVLSPLHPGDDNQV